MLFKILGVLSALIFLIGDTPYLIDTMNAKIKPHRVTWGIIALQNAIGFANQSASGATNSLWLFGAATLMTGAIFLASLKNGVGGQAKTDIFCLIISLLGVVLWITFDSPTYSILALLLADVFALWPTFAKAKKHPESETRISWLVGTISTLLATISVGKLNWQLLVIPVFSTLLQGYMVFLLYVRNNHGAAT